MQSPHIGNGNRLESGRCSVIVISICAGVDSLKIAVKEILNSLLGCLGYLADYLQRIAYSELKAENILICLGQVEGADNQLIIRIVCAELNLEFLLSRLLPGVEVCVTADCIS